MKNTFRFQGIAIALLVALSLLGSRLRAEDMTKVTLHQRYNLMGDSIGLVGYDPVAYFPEGGGKPAKGLIGTSYEFDGVTYRFVSQENLNLFKANPGKYVPVYGGWCAWAVPALGKRVDVDPESFEIRNGKLYVFYRDKALDTRSLWLKDPDGFVTKGTSKWTELSR